MTTASAIALLQSALLLLSLVQSIPSAPASLREMAIATATNAISQATLTLVPSSTQSMAHERQSATLTLPNGVAVQADTSGNIVNMNTPSAATPSPAISSSVPITTTRSPDVPKLLPSKNPANPPRASLSLAVNSDSSTTLNLTVGQDVSASPLQFYNLEMEIYDPMNPDSLSVSVVMNDATEVRRIGSGHFMRSADQYTPQRMVPVFQAHVDAILSGSSGVVPSGTERNFPIVLSAPIQEDPLSQTLFKVTKVEFLAVDSGEVISLLATPSLWQVSWPL